MYCVSNISTPWETDMVLTVTSLGGVTMGCASEGGVWSVLPTFSGTHLLGVSSPSPWEGRFPTIQTPHVCKQLVHIIFINVNCLLDAMGVICVVVTGGNGWVKIVVVLTAKG